MRRTFWFAAAGSSFLAFKAAEDLHVISSSCSCFLLSVTIAYAAADDVSTQHDDAARTGAQLHETVLKPGNIKSNTFGRLYERSVNGQIIAQPLYTGGVTIPGSPL